MSQGGVMLLMLSSLFQLGITDQCQIYFWHVNNAAQVQRGQGYLEAYVSRLSQSKADVSQDASVGGLLPSRVDSGHVSCCITQVQRLEGGGPYNSVSISMVQKTDTALHALSITISEDCME